MNVENFSEPVDVQLPGYPVMHRVLGVEHCRNPYGYGRTLHSYAIAEYNRGGGWKRLQDPCTRMRLANRVEHSFPNNPEPYANSW